MTVATRPPARLGESLRWLLRAAVASAAAAGICAVLYGRVPTTLHGTFDVIGYPLFADFNVNRYFDAYYLCAFVGPAIAIGLFALLARVGPLARLAPARHAPAAPTAPDGAGAPVAPERAPHTHPRLGAVSRLVGAGVLLATEIVAVARPAGSTVAWIAAIAAGYVLAIVGVTAATRRGAALPVLNGFGPIAMVPLLYGVSRATSVATPAGTTTYAWLPWWLVAVATALLVAFHLRRAARPRGPVESERALLLFVAIPITIFLAKAVLPGALGQMDIFGEGEYLAGGWQLLHGLVPFKDLYLIHGIFDDALKGVTGLEIFGTTRWAGVAGISMLFVPLYWVCTYYFCALLFRRRTLFVLSVAAAILCGVLLDWDPRFMFWPLVLVLLARLLDRGTRTAAALLAAALVTEAFFIPEMSLALVACGATVAVADLAAYWHRRSIAAFRTTGWLAAFLGLFGAAVGIWLVAAGALSGFVGYFRDFADAHSLAGGVPLYATYGPVTPDRFGVSTIVAQPPPMFTRDGIVLWLPVVAVVVTILLVTAAVRGGRRLATIDWLCVASALFVALYYQKGISRADTGHLAEVFEVTVPLLVLLCARGVFALDALATRASLGHRLAARGVTPASAALLVLTLVAAPTSLTAVATGIPSQHTATAPAAPSPVRRGGPGLGYGVDAVRPGVVGDLARLFARYAGPTGAVFDFSNAPGIVNFLLERRPATRFLDVAQMTNVRSQREAIADLIRSRPKIVLFHGVGLGTWDYISNEVRDPILSDWLLNHYRPFVEADGELLLVRDTAARLPPLPALSGPVASAHLYYRLGRCSFGYIPNFLAPSHTTTVRVAFTKVKSGPNGSVYRFVAPRSPSDFHVVDVTVRGTGPIGLALTDVAHKSTRDIAWVARSPGRTQVDAGSCLQWHGFGRTLYLRVLDGTPTAVRLGS